MILLKSCLRCQGDMLREEIIGDVELVCLQCGYRSYHEAQMRPVTTARVARKAA